MLTIQIPSCPICYATHTAVVEPSDQPVTLICPTFGGSYQAQIAAQANVLPIHLFGTARQGILFPSTR